MKKKCKNILNACRIGDIACVKQIIERSNVISRHAIPIAITNGHFEILKLLISHNAPVGEYAINTAAQTGQLEMLKYLVSIGIKPGPFTFSMAAESGHLPIIKYLFKINAPIYSHTLDFAVRHGRLKIVKYLLKKVPLGDPIDIAVNYNQLEILKFLIDKVPTKNKHLVDDARVRGFPEIVEFLLWNDFPFKKVEGRRYQISDKEYNVIKNRVLVQKNNEVGKILLANGIPLHLTGEFTKYITR